MSHRINLSTSFNLSLGFVPAILTILLGEFIAKDFAIYIGALMGVVYSLSNYYKNPTLLPNFILYIVTVVLLILSAVSVFNITDWPKNSLPITLEIAIVIPLLIISFNKTRFINSIRNRVKPTTKRHYVEAGISAIISIRVALILAFIHYAILTVMILFSNTLSNSVLWVMQVLMPIIVFSITVILNQIGLHFFNKIISDTVFIPLVDDKGDVTGKILYDEIPSRGDKVMLPIVRIAIEYKGMLFLSHNNSIDKEKTDTPLQSYITYEETIENAAKRLMSWAFPTTKDLEPRFSIKYKFTGIDKVRLVYLYMLNLDDDSLLSDDRFIGGKLWTLNQIEDNLDKGFFSDVFENEFEHLKDIIEIREKYKES